MSKEAGQGKNNFKGGEKFPYIFFMYSIVFSHDFRVLHSHTHTNKTEKHKNCNVSMCSFLFLCYFMFFTYFSLISLLPTHSRYTLSFALTKFILMQRSMYPERNIFINFSFRR
jgi:hypothetical protein